MIITLSSSRYYFLLVVNVSIGLGISLFSDNVYIFVYFTSHCFSAYHLLDEWVRPIKDVTPLGSVYYYYYYYYY